MQKFISGPPTLDGGDVFGFDKAKEDYTSFWKGGRWAYLFLIVVLALFLILSLMTIIEFFTIADRSQNPYGGTNYQVTSTSSVNIVTGPYVFTVNKAGKYKNGMRVRATVSSGSNIGDFVEGFLTINGNQFTIKTPPLDKSGTTTESNWSFSVINDVKTISSDVASNMGGVNILIGVIAIALLGFIIFKFITFKTWRGKQYELEFAAEKKKFENELVDMAEQNKRDMLEQIRAGKILEQNAEIERTVEQEEEYNLQIETKRLGYLEKDKEKLTVKEKELEIKQKDLEIRIELNDKEIAILEREGSKMNEVIEIDKTIKIKKDEILKLISDPKNIAALDSKDPKVPKGSVGVKDEIDKLVGVINKLEKLKSLIPKKELNGFELAQKLQGDAVKIRLTQEKADIDAELKQTKTEKEKVEQEFTTLLDSTKKREKLVESVNDLIKGKPLSAEKEKEINDFLINGDNDLLKRRIKLAQAKNFANQIASGKLLGLTDEAKINQYIEENPNSEDTKRILQARQKAKADKLAEIKRRAEINPDFKEISEELDAVEKKREELKALAEAEKREDELLRSVGHSEADIQRIKAASKAKKDAQRTEELNRIAEEERLLTAKIQTERLTEKDRARLQKELVDLETAKNNDDAALKAFEAAQKDSVAANEQLLEVQEALTSKASKGVIDGLEKEKKIKLKKQELQELLNSQRGNPTSIRADKIKDLNTTITELESQLNLNTAYTGAKKAIDTATEKALEASKDLKAAAENKAEKDKVLRREAEEADKALRSVSPSRFFGKTLDEATKAAQENLEKSRRKAGKSLKEVLEASKAQAAREKEEAAAQAAREKEEAETFSNLLQIPQGNSGPEPASQSLVLAAQAAQAAQAAAQAATQEAERATQKAAVISETARKAPLSKKEAAEKAAQRATQAAAEKRKEAAEKRKEARNAEQVLKQLRSST